MDVEASMVSKLNSFLLIHTGRDNGLIMGDEKITIANVENELWSILYLGDEKEKN